MYTTLMVPVDLAHVQSLDKALRCAADLARLWKAAVVYVGVTAGAPSALAHNPAEFQQRLDAFAQAQAAQHGITASGHMALCNDPAVELEQALMKAIDDTSADLVVMASHIPGLKEHLWPSNGGQLAGHAKASVLVVRP
jgi:nucleotide-binding universal stress UspA family protein